MRESFFKDDPEEPDIASSLLAVETDEDKDSEDTEQEAMSPEIRAAAIMSYIPFLCFVPLLEMRENKEAHFHARQGVLLFLVEVAAAIFLIDGVSKFVFRAVLLVTLALALVGIYYAIHGQRYKLPIVGELADKSKLQKL
jgi:fumarate reductase subunit D